MREGIGDDNTLSASQPAQAVERRPQRRGDTDAIDQTPVALIKRLLAHLEAVALADTTTFGEPDVHVEIALSAHIEPEHPRRRQAAQDAVLRDGESSRRQPQPTRVGHVLVHPNGAKDLPPGARLERLVGQPSSAGLRPGEWPTTQGFRDTRVWHDRERRAPRRQLHRAVHSHVECDVIPLTTHARRGITSHSTVTY